MQLLKKFVAAPISVLTQRIKQNLRPVGICVSTASLRTNWVCLPPPDSAALHAHHTGKIAAGTTLAGAMIGLAEAIYGHVPYLYAAALYGALWALAGVLGGFVCSIVFAARMSGKPLISFAAALAAGSSVTVLLRFILFRDIYAEAAGYAPRALGAALMLGVLVGAVILGTGRVLERRLRLPLWLRTTAVWVIPCTAGLLFGVLAAAPEAPAPNATALPPHAIKRGAGVILVVADALRADALGAYGATAHRDSPATPALDVFAAESRVFMNASAQASWTKPAMASLFTSRLPSGHNTMSKTAVLPDSLPTLATALQAAGVSTAAVVTNYNLVDTFGYAHGFDHFNYLAPARYLGAPPRPTASPLTMFIGSCANASSNPDVTAVTSTALAVK